MLHRTSNPMAGLDRWMCWSIDQWINSVIHRSIAHRLPVLGRSHSAIPVVAVEVVLCWRFESAECRSRWIRFGATANEQETPSTVPLPATRSYLSTSVLGRDGCARKVLGARGKRAQQRFCEFDRDMPFVGASSSPWTLPRVVEGRVAPSCRHRAGRIPRGAHHS